MPASAADVREPTRSQARKRPGGRTERNRQQVAAVAVDHCMQDDSSGDARRPRHDVVHLLGVEHVRLDVQRHVDVRELRHHRARQQFARRPRSARHHKDRRPLPQRSYMLVVPKIRHSPTPFSLDLVLPGPPIFLEHSLRRKNAHILAIAPSSSFLEDA